MLSRFHQIFQVSIASGAGVQLLCCSPRLLPPSLRLALSKDTRSRDFEGCQQDSFPSRLSEIGDHHRMHLFSKLRFGCFLHKFELGAPSEQHDTFLPSDLEHLSYLSPCSSLCLPLLARPRVCVLGGLGRCRYPHAQAARLSQEASYSKVAEIIKSKGNSVCLDYFPYLMQEGFIHLMI